MHYILGLGNPGNEYENTRHNTGRMVVSHFHDISGFSLWKEDLKPKMQISQGAISGAKTTLVLPDTFMNKSGHAAAHFIKNKKGAGNLVVLHDDLDLPLGSIKISYGRSSGGHRGVESVIKALKTKDFVRVRIGVSPARVSRAGGSKTSKGVAKKPTGEERILKFLLSKFTPPEMAILKKLFKNIDEALAVIVTEGHQMAMNKFN